MKLTTSYYYTPHGRSIHEMGIEPDLIVDEAGNVADQNAPIVDEALAALKREHQNRLHARL